MNVRCTKTSPLMKGLLMLMAAVMIVSMLPANATGDYGKVHEYTTVVLSEAKFFKVGDEATLEIRFYNKDTLEDADDVNLSIGYPEWGMGRYVEVDEASAKTGTGIYRVKFTIEEDDATWGGVSGTINCTKNGSRAGDKWATTMFYLQMETDMGFKVDVTVDKPYFKAGDTVRFSVVFTNNSQKVDPDEINYAKIEINGERQDVTDELVKDAVGEYHYDYTAPDDTVNKVVWFEVDAEYGEDWEDDDVTAVLDYYQVWLHTKSLSSTAMSGELGVCGMDGSPVVADIYFSYSYWDSNDTEVKKEITGTTDAKGLLPVDLDYAGNEYDDEIKVMIWANGTGGRGEAYQQLIQEYIDLPEEPDVDDTEFEVITAKEFLQAGKEVTIEYTAYREGKKLANKDIYYIFYTTPGGTYMMDPDDLDGSMGKVYLVGKATTDANGKFSVTFTAPDKTMILETYFKTDSGARSAAEQTWNYDNNMVFVGSFFNEDENIDISVENLGRGKTATVTVKRPGQSGGKGAVFVGPVPTSVTNIDLLMLMDEQLEWEKLNEEVEAADSTPFTGDSFTSQVGIPAFFPADYNIIIMCEVWEEDAGSWDGGTAYINYIIFDKDGKPVDASGGGDDDDDGDDGGFLPGFEIAGLLFILASCAYVFKKKRN